MPSRLLIDWPRRGSVVVVPLFSQACSNCKRVFTGVLLTCLVAMGDVLDFGYYARR
jgi:hypothetical protein